MNVLLNKSLMIEKFDKIPIFYYPAKDHQIVVFFASSPRKKYIRPPDQVFLRV